MNDQMKLDDFWIDRQTDYADNFESAQAENESEEDIKDVNHLSFSDLAVTSTDWTVETLINQIRRGNIQLDPSFQRRDAWSPKVKSKFIESLFMGLPIPQIILAEQRNKKGKFIVIDGKQRLLSIKQFALPDANESGLKLSGLDVLSHLNQLTYADIDAGIYSDNIDMFNNQTIRTVVIKNWKNVGLLYLLFLRLNTGSVKLSPQELRQALYPGKFVDFINSESSHNNCLQRMLNIKKADFRMRDVEILIRFYAFYFFSEYYSGSMQYFLDTTCDKLNQIFTEKDDVIRKALDDFNSAVNLTFAVFSEKKAFRKYKNQQYERKYNRAVIDIMLFYFSQIKDTEALLNHRDHIQEKFAQLCSLDQQFLSSLESTTKSLSSVHYRFRVWGEYLCELTGENLYIPNGY